MLHFPLYAAIAGLLILAGCDNKEVESQPSITPKTTSAPERPKDSPQNVKSESKEIEDVTKETVESVKKDVTEIAAEAVDSAQETQDKITEKINQTTDELAQRLEKTAQEGQERLDKVAAEVKEALPAVNKPEVASVKKPAKAAVCASCHGQNGEKVALGKSKIMNTLSKQEIIDSLKGYQDGTYGGAMKSVMLGQVKNLSDEDIEELAEFYSAK